MPASKKTAPKPPAKKKPAKASAMQPEAAPTPTTSAPEDNAPRYANPHNLPILYHKLTINERSTTSELGPITPDEMVLMLDWETEKQYQVRMVAEKGGKPEHYLFGESIVGKDGIARPVHCLDTAKQKVVCWSNAGNRPFDSEWCEHLIQTILRGQWAGPLTVPGETVNGETIRVSRYGRVLSGQHTGTALKLADERLQESRAQAGNAANPKYPAWNGHEHCVIETIVITGLSEDERVLRTIDYNRPRSAADMLFTMEVFRDNTPAERREMTRMLSSAVDLLWARTGAQGYKTHPEVVGFLERHKRLLKCVEHLFIEDSTKGKVMCRNCHGTGDDGDKACPVCTGKGEVPSDGRRISKLWISAGQAAAMEYLMGCSSQKTTDRSDAYRNESPPSEKKFDWGYWDKARAFWAGLAGDRAFLPVRLEMGRLITSSPTNEDNLGLGGRANEKLALISKAWLKFKHHPDGTGAPPPFSDEDRAPGGCLALSYTNIGPPDKNGFTTELPDGQISLIDEADFQGIDCPDGLGRAKPGKAGSLPPTLTKEQIRQAIEEASDRKAGR